MMIFAEAGLPAATGWVQILTPVMVAIAIAIQQFSSYYNTKQSKEDAAKAQLAVNNAAQAANDASQAANRAAIKTNEAAQVAKESNATVQGKLGEIHVLVNNQMSQALLKIAELEQRWSSRFPEDVEARIRAQAATDDSHSRPPAKGAPGLDVPEVKEAQKPEAPTPHEKKADWPAPAQPLEPKVHTQEEVVEQLTALLAKLKK